jgi:hypothetical protein
VVCEIPAMKHANATIVTRSHKKMLVSIKARNSQRLIIKKKDCNVRKKMTKSFCQIIKTHK